MTKHKKFGIIIRYEASKIQKRFRGQLCAWRYLGGGAALTCSEGTAQEIDAEVQKLVEEGHQTALDTLRRNRFKLHEIAHYLQKKETITGEEFMNILTRDDGFAPRLTPQSE